MTVLCSELPRFLLQNPLAERGCVVGAGRAAHVNHQSPDESARACTGDRRGHRVFLDSAWGCHLGFATGALPCSGWEWMYVGPSTDQQQAREGSTAWSDSSTDCKDMAYRARYLPPLSVQELQKLTEGQQPFTLVMDDPSGNSYIETTGDGDAALTVEQYERSVRQALAIGLPVQEELEENTLESVAEEDELDD